MTGWSLFLLFLQSVLLSYSGWGSVAVVRASLVEQHALLSDAQLTAFLALSQITPGPLGFYLLFAGYSVRGFIGASLAWMALAAPSLLVIPIVVLMERSKKIHAIRGAVSGVIVASATLMITTAVELSPQVLTSPIAVAIAALSLAGLFSGRLPSFAIVTLAAIIGAFFP